MKNYYNHFCRVLDQHLGVHQCLRIKSFFMFFSPGVYFLLPKMSQKEEKMRNKQTMCEVPICWSKYTTECAFVHVCACVGVLICQPTQIKFKRKFIGAQNTGNKGLV